MKKRLAVMTTIALLSSTFGTSTFASTYQVQKGDTLTQIARKHQLSVSELKAINNLSSDMIFVNQTIKIPSATSSKASTAKTPTTATPKEKSTIASMETVQKPITEVGTYTITKGDTLCKIANKHQMTLTDLMTLNNLTHDAIFPGQALKVAKSNVTVHNGVPETTSSPTEYIVQKGDTLGKISSHTGMTIDDLKKLNTLASDTIFVGQKLVVAGGENSSSVAAPVKATVMETTPPLDYEVADYLLAQAKEWVGIPYLWAGTTLDGLDCSGFIYYAFNDLGTGLERQSTEGYFGRSYYIDTPQIGDLVFFVDTYKPGISHMGIYLGNNEFIHSSTNKGVIISNLDEPYYQQRFDGFKRFS